MKDTRMIMGMPVTIEILDLGSQDLLNQVFSYFEHIDQKFSTYKDTSEITKINKGTLNASQASDEMKEVLRLAEQTKQETNGYFAIQTPAGNLDPSGLVKGWAIYQASQILDKAGSSDYFIDAGGDIQVRKPNNAEPWKVGIQNPFNNQEIIKVLNLSDQGLATSGTYNRGGHIYNPKSGQPVAEEIVSLSVIGPNIYEADRFATAAFAMGKEGIYFIEKLPGFEAYQISKDGTGTGTSGFDNYTRKR